MLEIASSLAGGKFINTPASGAKSTARVKNDEDGDHEISFLSLPKESRAAMVGACISLLNCAYLLPASTYARRTIWDAMFSSSSGSTFATKWALERANEWNDLRAINPALRFAAALDDDTSLMTGRSHVAEKRRRGRAATSFDSNLEGRCHRTCGRRSVVERC